MDLILNNKEKIRILNKDILNQDSVFVDVSREENHQEEYSTDCVSVECYEMHQVFIFSKMRAIKTVVFKKGDPVCRKDLSHFWQDAELIYTNSKLL